MRSLRAKRVLITGAAQGIGRETALRFAREGAALVLVDLQSETLGNTVDELRQAGTVTHGYQLDVTDFDAIELLRQQIAAEVGTIDVLVNNAGTVYGGPFLDVPWAKHLQTYRVNTLGLVAMSHAFLPQLIAQPESHLVNIASACGLVGLPFGSTYASSKWSVIGFSESLRLELKKQGHRHVGVTSVCPSVVNTALFRGTTPPKTTRVLQPAYLADRIVRAVLANRAFVMEPALVRLSPLLRGLLPLRVFDWLSEVFGTTTAMATWAGSTKSELQHPATNAPRELEASRK
ncbi:MAG: SDR family NAD(P)-dependent oxidoreductase [Pirellulales bacterium]|nr:SDR family NAD(P)-dependent oxidoreductase [Pirellulales bacterium]